MKMLIGGTTVDASSGLTIDVINPVNLQAIDTIPRATQKDVCLAVENAVKGYKEWSEIPMWKRADILKTFSAKLRDSMEELGELMMMEVGKPIREARAEIVKSADNVDAFIEGAHVLWNKAYQPNNRQFADANLVITIREPLGVVVAIAPFNNPIGCLTRKVIPGLLMGNSVIVKPASDTPLTQLRYVEILAECGVPANAIQSVTGRGKEIGAWLTGDSRVAAVTMTGSTEAGIEIAKIAAENLIKVALELGGNDALVILPDSDLNLAVSESVGRLKNCGQICCSTKRYIIHNSIKDAFVEKLIFHLEKKKIGDPAMEDTDVGPLVSLKAAKTVEEQIQHSVSQGAKILFGGHRFSNTYFEPTILEATPECDVAKDMEIFGPVWTVIGYDTKEEALQIANNTIYGLSSAVMGSDARELLWFAKRMQAGTCVINGSSNYLAPDSPFGGYKKSGIGRESIADSLEELSQIKTICFKKMF
ncbi:MAG: aldehyde dehydrogenase family protein [Clostridiaceae bacterium]|jgi:succinate-semialdehyde dehydrogenase/glutarate-semialdehyde dehydrogenase|nr:aldehyde dehydrogenase family protein [Clostridiaceae bacterium]